MMCYILQPWWQQLRNTPVHWTETAYCWINVHVPSADEGCRWGDGQSWRWTETSREKKKSTEGLNGLFPILLLLVPLCSFSFSHPFCLFKCCMPLALWWLQAPTHPSEHLLISPTILVFLSSSSLYGLIWVFQFRRTIENSAAFPHQRIAQVLRADFTTDCAREG